LTPTDATLPLIWRLTTKDQVSYLTKAWTIRNNPKALLQTATRTEEDQPSRTMASRTPILSR